MPTRLPAEPMTSRHPYPRPAAALQRPPRLRRTAALTALQVGHVLAFHTGSARAADPSHPYSSRQLKEFVLRATGANMKVEVESKPTDLKPDWNLLTVAVGGGRRSFLVFGGEKGTGYKPGNK